MLGMVVLLLAGVITATPPTNPWYTSVLQHLVTGTLSGRPLVVYLDETLGFSTSQLIRSALHDTPLVLADLRMQGKEWCERQTQEVLRAGWLVHVALLGSNATFFFEGLAAQECNWQPQYLLLVNTQSDSPDVLTEEAFSRVERLALLSVEDQASNNSSLSAFIYSFFPFAHRTPIRRTAIRSNSTSLQHLFALQHLFVDRFPSFEGYQFQVASWLDDYPYLYLSSGGQEDLLEMRELQTGEAGGLQVEILNSLGDALNFTYTMMSRPEDWQWGELQDGAWTGMLGEVHSGKKNFTVNFFGYNVERTRAFDASPPYWMEGYGLTLLTPPPLARWRAAYYPFHVSVWWCCVATFLLVVIVWVMQGGSSSGDGREWSYLLRPLLNQSLPGLPSSQGLRVFIATWCLSTFILTIAYTANLVAFLSVPVFPPRIRTVEELAASSLRYGTD
ncbi:Glutamate receptor ionotropic, delta-1 [Portunus trituberculatus]|uniref:Glutamate receptor ionotropic, delta-1 n=1 Tax=Portunus trituberculatus TaxID=210409 RepID=A0A5B7E2F2_PORTR|nr:Glutamate receptor ionotropic, delta-1 [Portunus trituberculatus]